MATILLEQFSGIAPIFDPRKLPAAAAVRSQDVKFDGGDVRPLCMSVQEEVLAFDVGTQFKYVYKDDARWLAWPDGSMVSVVASPIAQDDLGRVYWSRVDPNSMNDDGADNYPRAASQPTQADVVQGNANVRRLGVPPAGDALAWTEVKADTTVTGSQITAVSRTSPATVTAPNHPFKEGWSVLVTSDPGSDGGMAEMSGQEFTVHNPTSDTFDLIGADGTNYTAFTSKTKLTIARVYGVAEIESRTYVYTYVTDWAEEGAPSKPSAPQDIRYDSSASLSIPVAMPSWASTAINRVRVYRSATGGGGTQFFFVKEIAITSASGTLTALDDTQAGELAELLPSEGWTPPPNGLQGLTAMPNGFLVGFNGNTLYCSEPYQPHAWPDAYRRTTEDPIIGIGLYGQTLVLATTRKPYLASGSDPASLTLSQVDVDAPCLSAHSVCSVGTGVAWASPDGLVIVDGSGAHMVTTQLATRKQWMDVWNTDLRAIFYDGRYIALAATGETQLLQLTANGTAWSTTTVVGTAPAIDPDDYSLHFAAAENGSAVARYRFDAGEPMSGTWSSKVFTLPHATNLARGQVFADGYPVNLTVGYANLQPGGQTGGEITEAFTLTVWGAEPFALPGGYLSREYRVTLESKQAVQLVKLTDNADELR